MGAQHRKIRQAVYALKRAFGLPIVVCRGAAPAIDFATGAMTQGITSYPIKRAIVLDTRELRKFSYDLSYIASNRNTTYGGFYDQSTRGLMVSKRDISIIPTNEDWVIYANRRYEMVEVHQSEKDEFFILIVKETKNTLNDGVSASASDSVGFGDNGS